MPAAGMMQRILCIDIEGGYGGSSRSLYESLHHMDRTGLDIEVWCAKVGPIQQRYAALGISTRVVPGLPRFSALPRLSRNLLALAMYARAWLSSGGLRRALREAAQRFDVIHLNHESLHGLGVWLRGGSRRAVITMHVRTILPPGPVARWQSRRMARGSDAMVFITENEQAAFQSQADGHVPTPGRVIYNIAMPFPAAVPHPAIPRDGRLVIACLSNFAWVRGIDRLIDIARALNRRGRNDILIVQAGQIALPRSLHGVLGDVARSGGTLRDYAERMGVADRMLFLGHVSDPEAVLAASDLLAKPTREANPWGRDIIEALAAGRPVLTVGSYDRFVENGVTGILQREFDDESLADDIVALADDRPAIARMGREAVRRVASLCDGPARAADLRSFWQMACDGTGKPKEDRH